MSKKTCFGTFTAYFYPSGGKLRGFVAYAMRRSGDAISEHDTTNPCGNKKSQVFFRVAADTSSSAHDFFKEKINSKKKKENRGNAAQ